MNTSLLYNDYPIPVSPRLATAIGLNESIILQQMHYWTMTPRNVRDGFSWVYNSIHTWATQFPFWSESTIKRTLASLEKQGLVYTGNFNRDRRDRTKWYRVNYEAVQALKSPDIPLGQIDPMQQVNTDQCVGSEWSDASGQNDPTITRDYPETTPETTNPSPDGDPSGEEDPPDEPIDPDIEVPEVIDPETWQSFVEHRRQIKSPMTIKAKTMLANKLCKLAKQGHNPKDLLEESIMNGWRGVFEPKGPAGRKHLPTSGFAETDYRKGLRKDSDGRYRI